KGVPTPVAWTRMKAPNSLMDPSPQATVDAVIAASAIAPKYAAVLDRESAYELLTKRLEAQTPPAAPAGSPAAPAAPAAKRQADPKPEPGIIEQVTSNTAFKSLMRSAGTVLGREITRSLFGTRRR
ncbi:MAG: helicase HerA-like domain-containing protein, partial [Humibacillus sp.]